MLDIFHLSYYEPFADETFAKLQSRFPWANRVQNIKGIFNGHKECARLAHTTMFYVVDADAILKDDFDFSYTPSPKLEYWDGVKQTECVHVWRCENPVNGLVYGYGGVKLFPREPLRTATDWHIDFTTSVSGKFKAMPKTSNSTYINGDAFTAYKSGFRECAKLASKTIKDPEGYYDSANDPKVLEHLEIWCTKGREKQNGAWAIAGAIAGRKYGEENAGDTKALDRINDFKWLKEQFNKKNAELNAYT